MKQRIKSLLAKAHLDVMEDLGNIDTNLVAEKFAELIVKECMEQVWYTREDGINGNVSEVIKDRIKQHFGVKE